MDQFSQSKGSCRNGKQTLQIKVHFFSRQGCYLNSDVGLAALYISKDRLVLTAQQTSVQKQHANNGR